jgi:unsaturated rhamnogalacturonyl hydrolase
MSSPIDKTRLKATAQQVYHFMTGEHPAASEQLGEVDANPASWGLNIDDWEWNPGVGVTSISDYYNTSQQPEVLDYLVGWVQRNKHKATKFQHVNVMAPFAIFPDMYRRTQDPLFLEMGREYGDWIVKNSVRTMTGAFQHGGNLTEEIWADTIFMVVLFLARLSRLTGDVTLAQEAARQLLLHLQYLQDPETGVLFHGYFCNEKNHKSNGRWTRGNGWITVGTPLILAEVKELIAVPDEIEQRYRRLVDGLIRYQADNGLWHTIMDRPDFYQETSGSAGIAAGILKSIHQGILPASYLPVVEKALGGVLQTITPEGCVTGVSGGTPIMNTLEEYNKLTRYPTLYGQGLTLMLLGEYIYC